MRFTSKADEDEAPPIHVILASQSIGRRHLLHKLSIPFRVLPTNVDEDKIIDSDPKKKIKKRAKAKLEEVITNPDVYSLPDTAESLIIKADSMAVYGKKTYGKCSSRNEVRDMIKELMGKTHTFITAVSIAHFGKTEDGKRKALKQWHKTEVTKVTMNKITGPELELYIKRYDLLNFAAGYALNEAPWNLIAKIDGSFTNVIGLPFEVILPIFRKLNILE